MKKAGAAIGMFAAAFVLTYFIFSFCVPAWRVNLEADSVTLFVETLKSMMPAKLLISLLAGAFASCIPFIRDKDGNVV